MQFGSKNLTRILQAESPETSQPWVKPNALKAPHFRSV